MQTQWLGKGIDFNEALNLQLALLEQRAAGEIEDTLLLLEHAPIYTIGRTRDKTSLRDSSHLPHPVIEIGRGGQATFHGPGQLVGYAILDLNNHGRDLHLYMRSIEEALIQTCETYNIAATRREGMTGVWVGNRKLASIGVGVRKWISYHGFAINIETQSLPPFEWITPCGLDGVRMTCINDEANQTTTSQEFGERFAEKFKSALSH